ncbi:hypothetical protein PG985_000325 [Apiospora marii]|uniref:uncharacterized protein n=1 Tax=Apiospora marii TaxID=335849 RepID=UPI00312D94AA
MGRVFGTKQADIAKLMGNLDGIEDTTYCSRGRPTHAANHLPAELNVVINIKDRLDLEGTGRVAFKGSVSENSYYTSMPNYWRESTVSYLPFAKGIFILSG